MSNRSLLFFSSLAALAACFTTGCSMFQRSAPTDDWQTLAPPKAVATFFVEVRRGNKQPQIKQLPLKQALTVQHLLKETGTLVSSTAQMLPPEKNKTNSGEEHNRIIRPASPVKAIRKAIIVARYSITGSE